MAREMDIATEKGKFSNNYLHVTLNLNVYILCINIYKMTGI